MTYYLTIIKDRKAEISEEKKATIHPILSPFEGPDVLNKEVSLERGITIISDMQEVDADNDQFFNVSARISEGRIAEIWVDDDFSAPILFMSLRDQRMTPNELKQVRSYFPE